MMYLMCVPFAGTLQLHYWEHWVAWDAMGLAFLPLYYVSAHLSITSVLLYYLFPPSTVFDPLPLFPPLFCLYSPILPPC